MITKLLIFFSGMVFGELATVLIMAICKSASEEDEENENKKL